MPASPAMAGQALAVPWTPTDDERELAVRMVDLLNATRVEAGIDPLADNPDLDLLAYQHSREMADRGLVSHHSYRFGVSTESRIKLAFPRVFQFAENIARNRSAVALHEALLRSPGHRLNRMDPSFTHIGMGVVRATANQLYMTEVFVRAASPEQLLPGVLYTIADPAILPRDEPTQGDVVSETVTVRPPGADDPAYWTGLGIDAFQEDRYEAAVEHFRHALELSPGYDFARFNLGRALIRAGKAERALEVLDGYLRSHPDDIDAWRALGTAALVSQHYGRAEDSFRRVLSADARDAGAWYNLGLSVEYQDRLKEAEGAYAQALHLDPDMEPARDALRRVRR